MLLRKVCRLVCCHFVMQKPFHTPFFIRSLDYAYGFGGVHGVQTDRVDKTAVGWDHIEKLEKHESQRDYSKGNGQECYESLT